LTFNDTLLDEFFTRINQYKTELSWTKDDLVNLFFMLLPEFGHKETGKYLDQKM
jgi:hypothetical protein